MPRSSTSSTIPFSRWLIILSLLALAGLGAVVLLLPGCTEAEPMDQAILVADQTVAIQNPSWRNEVPTQVGAIVDEAMAQDVERLDIVAMGNNTQDAAKVATVDLTKVEGNTEVKREESRRALRGQIQALVVQIIEQPVAAVGTDVVASLRTAADLCHSAEARTCRIWALTDLEDQRVTGAGSSEAASEAVGDRMPDLRQIPVVVSGLGASGSDAATVDLVQRAWTALLDGAGSPEVRISRSI